MSSNSRVLNELFITKLGSSEGRDKAAEMGGAFIRDRLREVVFCDKIIPCEQVTRADCHPSVNHDLLVKIIEVEPKSRAMTVTFRGQPTANFIRGPRAEISFFTIASEVFQKTEQELLSYEMPITKIIEENAVKDIQEVKDREFLLHIEAACQALQKEANGGVAKALNATAVLGGNVVEFSIRKGQGARTAPATDTATVFPLQRADLVNARKMLSGNRLRPEVILLTEVDWDDILQWTAEDFGHTLQSETAKDGYTYNTLLGTKYIRTIKTDILRPGNMYIFTSPEFLGRSYQLNNTKFYVDKVANVITFQAWQDVGMGIVNVASVRKLELYGGDANPETDTDNLLSNFIPVEEDELGAVNNRVDQGLTFPKVQTY